jgi:hypothetical protein
LRVELWCKNCKHMEIREMPDVDILEELRCKKCGQPHSFDYVARNDSGKESETCPLSDIES